MNCKLAEQNLALWVGGDLDEASVRELEEHLALCSACRAVGRRLKSTQRTLVKASHIELTRPKAKATGTTNGGGQVQMLRDHDESVWPNVARGLRALEARKRRQRFNGWVPAAAVIAACLAIILSPRPATQNTMPQSYDGPGFGQSADMGVYNTFSDGSNFGQPDNGRVGFQSVRELMDLPRGNTAGKVNSSIGEFAPGFRNLLDERPVTK